MKAECKAQGKEGRKGQGDRPKAHASGDHRPKGHQEKDKDAGIRHCFRAGQGHGVEGAELLGALLRQGVMAHINQAIDFETASLVADEFGYELELGMFQEETLLAESEDRPEDLIHRPPVVTIMGHVDHGRPHCWIIFDIQTSRRASRGHHAAHRAYYVETEGGDIVFLDTRAMRPSPPCGPGAQR